MLLPGNLIRVAAGETIPCDGEITEGVSSVIEAVLTGEQMPVGKSPGDAVSAGTVNSENPLLVRVSAVGHQTRLSAILQLVEKARSDKPATVAMADRVAGYFVAAVLIISALVAFWWWQHQPEEAIWVVLSVLVVTCPCALSLATPAAIAVATGELRQRGFLISRSRMLEVLSQVDRVVFDKTGTLTLGDLSIVRVIELADQKESDVLAIAATLEQDSRHPIARAFAGIEVAESATDVVQEVGSGISATIEANHFAIGQPDYIGRLFGLPVPAMPAVDAGQLPLLLAEQSRPLAWIILQDQLRSGAASAIQQLTAQGLGTVLLSGDRVAAVENMATKLGIQQWFGQQSPAAKLDWVNRCQQTGHRVLMVGDGINDVPVLSGADASVALGDASDFARIHADSILLSGNLNTLPEVIALARRTRQIIRQNLTWALLYNLLALPLAAAGMIPPWAAAIGMSASSLLVVGNALRLSRRGDLPIMCSQQPCYAT